MIGLTVSAVYWGRVTVSALLRASCVGVTVGAEVGAAVAGHSMWMKEDGHGFETTMKYISH